MKKLLATLPMLFLPAVVFAQGQDLQGILDIILQLLNSLIPILIVIAIIGFFYGLAKFIFSAGDSEARGQGIQIMIYGVVTLFVIVSVWGLVAILQNTFDVDEEATTIETPGTDDFQVDGGGFSL